MQIKWYFENIKSNCITGIFFNEWVFLSRNISKIMNSPSLIPNGGRSNVGVQLWPIRAEDNTGLQWGQRYKIVASGAREYSLCVRKGCRSIHWSSHRSGVVRLKYLETNFPVARFGPLPNLFIASLLLVFGRAKVNYLARRKYSKGKFCFSFTDF